MSDQSVPGVSSLLADPGANGVASSVEQAWTQLAALRADSEFQAKFRAGDPSARGRVDEITRNLTRSNIYSDPSLAAKIGDKAAVDATQVRDRLAWDQVMDSMRMTSDFPEELEAALRAQQPLTPQQRRWAEQMKAQVTSDKGFLRKLEDGDRGAKRDWAIVNAWLSLPVARG